MVSAAPIFSNLDLRFVTKKRWELLAPLVHYPSGEIVPAGYETDFASIPAALHGFPLFLTPFGRYGKAAVFHDYGYENARERTEAERKRVDDRFLEMMKESSVPWLTRNWIHGAVRRWGGIVFFKKR